MALRNFDFAPLSRSTIGFDRMMRLFDDATRMVDNGESSYPPYNIEKTGEDSYRISMAVAGFGESDLSITQQANALLIAGRKQGDEDGQYLHHGLAARAFNRRFDLADFIKVTGASLVNGLLSIDLVREVPEAMKPRSITIANRPPETLKRGGDDGTGKAAKTR
jgi:molecular chaperone IbpA